MAQPYSQWKAMLAVAKASMRAIFKSPQAVFFSLFFPIVLIAIFGALGGRGGPSFDIAFDKQTDTSSALYQVLANAKIFDVHKAPEEQIEEDLKKGRITAVLRIRKDSSGESQYIIDTRTSSASQREFPQVQNILTGILNSMNPSKNSFGRLSKPEVVEGRAYKMIDFFLPGMLGFSLIGSAVFGVAFVFYSLRETLVLKRMYSTPIKKGYIVIGESAGRILFQLTTAVVIILFGKYAYGFTLSHGWVTFFELIFLCFLSLVAFMGFGFVISSFAKNQNVIPIYANLFMFPQYFLSGTFFPKSSLPQGMQGFIKYLPLTASNDAMRKVSFEGLHLFGVWPEILILLVWCVVIYAITIKVFRWD